MTLLTELQTKAREEQEENEVVNIGKAEGQVVYEITREDLDEIIKSTYLTLLTKLEGDVSELKEPLPTETMTAREANAHNHAVDEILTLLSSYKTK